jgi:hypothetical protein
MVQSQPGQIVHETLSQKSHNKKRAGGMAQVEGPEFKPQYHKRKANVRKSYNKSRTHYRTLEKKDIT